MSLALQPLLASVSPMVATTGTSLTTVIAKLTNELAFPEDLVGASSPREIVGALRYALRRGRVQERLLELGLDPDALEELLRFAREGTGATSIATVQAHLERAIALRDHIAEETRNGIPRDLAERIKLPSPPVLRTDWVAQNAAVQSHRRAVCQGRQSLPYFDLDRRADYLAGLIKRFATAPGDKVGLFFSRNRLPFFEITLGARRAGVPYTNFHTATNPQVLFETVMAQRYRLLFLDHGTAERMEPFRERLAGRGILVVDIDNRHPHAFHYHRTFFEQERPPALTPGLPTPDYPGPIMQSSGTTGAPKLIAVDARKTVGAEANKLFGVGPHDRHLVVGQLYHGGASAWARGHLNRGAEIVLLERAVATFDPAEVVGMIVRERVTNFWISAPWLHGLCVYLRRLPEKPDLSSLRAIYAGAAPFLPFLKKEAIELFGEILWDCYAITEFGLVSVLPPDQLLPHAATVGRPVKGVEIQTRGPSGEILGVNETGEIFLRTPLTGEEFGSSGDFGYLDPEGYLTVLGRREEQIRMGDALIFPREIENTLLEMEGIRDATLVSVDEKLAAVVVLQEGTLLGEAEVLLYLRGHLSPEKLPERVFFLPYLPRIPYKLSIPRLREMVQGALARSRG